MCYNIFADERYKWWSDMEVKNDVDVLKIIDSQMFKCYNSNIVHYFDADVV